eukprot:4420-Eustigmatos_ZCMA.PRE.1
MSDADCLYLSRRRGRRTALSAYKDSGTTPKCWLTSYVTENDRVLHAPLRGCSATTTLNWQPWPCVVCDRVD